MPKEKNLPIESDMTAMKPEGFVLVLNEKGAEWLKQQKPAPNQREEFRRKAAKLNIVKPYEPNV